MIIKQIKKLAFAGAVGAVAVAFSTGAAADTKTIKMGVTPGPHAEIMEQVKEIAADRGLEIQILEFSDYVQPNAALEAGDLDANSYQHEPYLRSEERRVGKSGDVGAASVDVKERKKCEYRG